MVTDPRKLGDDTRRYCSVVGHSPSFYYNIILLLLLLCQQLYCKISTPELTLPYNYYCTYIINSTVCVCVLVLHFSQDTDTSPEGEHQHETTEVEFLVVLFYLGVNINCEKHAIESQYT